MNGNDVTCACREYLKKKAPLFAVIHHFSRFELFKLIPNSSSLTKASDQRCDKKREGYKKRTGKKFLLWAKKNFLGQKDGLIFIPSCLQLSSVQRPRNPKNASNFNASQIEQTDLNGKFVAIISFSAYLLAVVPRDLDTLFPRDLSTLSARGLATLQKKDHKTHD